MDRSVRSLVSLGDASTSRVLNLVSIAKQKSEDADYAAAPLFLSPVINNAFPCMQTPLKIGQGEGPLE